MVRIWNVPCRVLDDRHLLAEHAELHTIWNVITGGLRGFSRHPETARWRGHLGALYRRHQEQVEEMARRGWRGHRSPLPEGLAPPGSWAWPPVSDAEVWRDLRDLAQRQHLAWRGPADAG